MLKCCLKVVSRVQTKNKCVVVRQQDKTCVTCDSVTRLKHLNLFNNTVSASVVISRFTSAKRSVKDHFQNMPYLIYRCYLLKNCARHL